MYVLGDLLERFLKVTAVTSWSARRSRRWWCGWWRKFDSIGQPLHCLTAVSARNPLLHLKCRQFIDVVVDKCIYMYGSMNMWQCSMAAAMRGWMWATRASAWPVFKPTSTSPHGTACTSGIRSGWHCIWLWDPLIESPLRVVHVFSVFENWERSRCERHLPLHLDHQSARNWQGAAVCSQLHGNSSRP